MLRLLVGLLLFVPFVAAQDIVVYSSRNEQLIKPVFDAFTKETGLKVAYRTDKEGPLLQRLKAEGVRTPADLLLTVDAGNLWKAKDLGLLQRVDSETLNGNVPAHLRDPDGQWFAVSVRARTLVYNTEKIKPDQLSTYANLADSSWKGEVLLRTSKKVYNQSLVAMLIAELGEEKTKAIVEGWVSNLAMPVFSSDTKLLEALGAGNGSVGIVNTYYLGRLMRKNPNLPLAVFWPDQDGMGVHVNISGAGLVKHAKNPENALKLLEWMTTENAQRLLADENLEYPANASIKPSDEVAAWGSFKQSAMNLSKAGELQIRAVKLMDQAGYK